MNFELAAEVAEDIGKHFGARVSTITISRRPAPNEERWFVYFHLESGLRDDDRKELTEYCEYDPEWVLHWAVEKGEIEIDLASEEGVLSSKSE
jgi:hypothetical protein